MWHLGFLGPTPRTNNINTHHTPPSPYTLTISSLLLPIISDSLAIDRI
jgi:hypothetical protein